jgi:iron complex outermembrane receptor protein
VKRASIIFPLVESFCQTSPWVPLLILCFLFMSCPLGSGPVFAKEPGEVNQAEEKAQGYPRFELEEVVVTATPSEEPIRKIPRNVTVITSQDIEQAPSNNVVDLLAREADVNLQSYFGTDKRAGVDIRGMGQTLVTNVIVMVDGFRLNPPDLGDAGFTSVPLDQIERIEIVRGAASVVYGDGAVGGVINIITKKGEKEPEARLYSSYGSYDTFDERASYRGQVENFDFNINGTYYDSDGYRDNGFLDKKDAAGRFGYDLTDYTRLSLSAAYHEDEYGLPGSVSIEDIDSRRRRNDTDQPDDSGEVKDSRVMGGMETDLGRWGIFKVDGAYRLRDDDYIAGFSPGKSRQEQTSKIDEDTKSLDASYVKEYEVAGLEHNFRAGLDYYQTDYISERPDERMRKNADVNSLGLFFTNQFALTGDLRLDLGYRWNTYRGTYREDELETIDSVDLWINRDKSDEIWHNNAYDVGLVYSLTEDTSLFASYATSFRIPNVDELARPPEDDDLKPQEGDHVEIGARHRIKGFAELSLTLFDIRIKDEIFFDGDRQVNRNFEEKTKRRGVEAEVKVYPAECLYLWGNYTYMTATFEDSDHFVPLVPRHTASVGMEWRMVDPLLLAITGTLVGSKYDGNDLDNDRFQKIDAYAVFDIKLTYTYKGLRMFAGANNIFDELYSTLAFSERYFTMPTRNYYGGMEWVF